MCVKWPVDHRAKCSKKLLSRLPHGCLPLHKTYNDADLIHRGIVERSVSSVGHFVGSDHQCHANRSFPPDGQEPSKSIGVKTRKSHHTSHTYFVNGPSPEKAYLTERYLNEGF